MSLMTIISRIHEYMIVFILCRIMIISYLSPYTTSGYSMIRLLHRHSPFIGNYQFSSHCSTIHVKSSLGNIKAPSLHHDSKSRYFTSIKSMRNQNDNNEKLTDKNKQQYSRKEIDVTSKIKKKIVIIGGGASGIFASIAAATAVYDKIDCHNNIDIIVVEATKNLLSKVKISGGGRCNVLHDTSIPVNIILQKGYPRGYKELKSIYYKRFTPIDAQVWFESHGVQLKTELDGRMFPTTDQSQTIIDTLLKTASQYNIQIYQQHSVQSIQYSSNEQQQKSSNFLINFREKTLQDDNSRSGDDTTSSSNSITCDAIILATGSSPAGYKLAQSLGHTVLKPVPSLFTLNTANDIKTPDTLLYGLAGLSVPFARIRFYTKEQQKQQDDDNDKTNNSGTTGTIKSKKSRKKRNYLEQEGPLLITHQGLSGPAALRLSSFGANEIAACNYRGQLTIHWAPTLGTTDDIFDELCKCTRTIPKRTVASRCPLVLDLSTIPSIPGSKLSSATIINDDDNDDNDVIVDGTKATKTTTTTQTAIPKRLWQSMVHQIGLDSNNIIAPVVWGVVSKKVIRQLAIIISECTITMTGKNTNKDEFVTAGGIDCSNEIDMTTMSSKLVPGLYCCGEVINVDGVTGGFNFMNCWSTGYVAGISAAEYVSKINEEEVEEVI
jgi:predicted flavoprotein YhiN